MKEHAITTIRALLESDASTKALYRKWLAGGGLEDFTDPLFTKLTNVVAKKAKAEIGVYAKKYSDAVRAANWATPAVYRTDVLEDEPMRHTRNNKYYILGIAALKWEHTNKMLLDLLVRFYFDGTTQVEIHPYPATAVAFRKNFRDIVKDTFGSVGFTSHG